MGLAPVFTYKTKEEAKACLEGIKLVLEEYNKDFIPQWNIYQEENGDYTVYVD